MKFSGVALDLESQAASGSKRLAAARIAIDRRVFRAGSMDEPLLHCISGIEMRFVRDITAGSSEKLPGLADWCGLVEVGATEEVAAVTADELAAALGQTGRTGRAEDGVVFLLANGAGFGAGRGEGLRPFHLHEG